MADLSHEQKIAKQWLFEHTHNHTLSEQASLTAAFEEYGAAVEQASLERAAQVARAECRPCGVIIAQKIRELASPKGETNDQ